MNTKVTIPLFIATTLLTNMVLTSGCTGREQTRKPEKTLVQEGQGKTNTPDHRSAQPTEKNKTSPPDQTPGLPMLGMSILPKGESGEWTNKAFTEAFEQARVGNIQLAIWRHQWGDIETSLGNHEWGEMDYEAVITKNHEMEVALVIEVIHTNTLGDYPDDLTPERLDDPEFIRSFNAFLTSLLERYGDNIHSIWIGNEVDAYLHHHPEQIEAFLTLFKEAEKTIKAVKPAVVVGIVSAYHLARNNQELAMLKSFANKGDALGLTLYMEDDAVQPNVGETINYFETVLNTFPDQKIAIIETAWSSKGPQGSETIQETYVQELATVLDKHGERFLFFSWFVLYDLPSGVNQEIAKSFGIDPNIKAGKEFISWQGSLGLLNNNGTPKPAWEAWKKELAGH